MSQAEASYFTFAKGINTEASLANWPEGFSVDEENYDLLIDGSRRKRKGLALAEWAAAGATSTSVATASAGTLAYNTFYWDKVAGDPTLHYVVIQNGGNLDIYVNDKDAISDTYVFRYSLTNSAASGATSTQLRENDIDVAFGNGVAFVTGRYIIPFSITYSSGTFVTEAINIVIRDYEGIDDGVAITEYPTSLSSNHTYNLENRGWKSADITTFHTGQSKYPNKAMIPWLGYVRATTANVAEADWTKQFSDDKLVAELFQDVSAPQGHFTYAPFSGTVYGTAGTPVSISTWTTSSTTAGVAATITVTTVSAHGYSTSDTVCIAGNKYEFNAAVTHKYIGSLDGFYVVTVVDATHFTFTYTNSSAFTLFLSWSNQYYTLGSTSITANLLAHTTVYQPESTAFWAGRVWYSGVSAATFSNKLYYSQITQNEAQYGKCYQQADPTDERISDPIDTDGGVLVIPEASGIYKMLSYSNSLLVFASTGVWQIGPGASGVFSPTSYSIRKVSDIGAICKKGITIAEHMPYYCGYNDIYRINTDPNTGFLVPENLSEFLVHSLYSSIPESKKVYIKAVYNDLSKKLFFLYGEDDVTYGTNFLNMALVFDTRLNAFTKYRFGVTSTKCPVTAFIIRQETDNSKKLVFLSHSGDIVGIRYYRFETLDNPSSYVDSGGSYNCYLLTGYNVAGNSAHYKQASYIWAFSRKTETGYTDVSGTLVPVNESSTTMQARWDWADASVSGKWGQAQEVYRHRRLYTPADVTDTFADGSPLVVTKNLVRGRGRSLHLKFSNADSTKDSWLMGWHITYNIQQGK
jgi:hypothetical protein